MMKHNIYCSISGGLIVIWFALISIGMYSCASDIEEELAESRQEAKQMMPEVFTARMSLEVSRIDFDAKNTNSRATSECWNNNDSIYLRFHTSGNIVTGKAVYDAVQEDWVLTYYGSLSRGEESQVEVSFFDNASIDAKGVVTLKASNGVYQDLNGSYIYSGSGNIKVKANLKPMTSRLKLVGNYCDYLHGLNYYKSYNLNTGEFAVDSTGIYFSSNKPEYFYVFRQADSNEIYFKHTYSSSDDYYVYCFASQLSENMCEIGKSGWMNMPSDASHNGWSMKQIEGMQNGFEWVDLGLPSGNKWSWFNLGFDEEEFEDTYLGATYAMPTGGVMPGAVNDKIWETWKYPWQMPTKEDFEELLEYTTSEFSWYGCDMTIWPTLWLYGAYGTCLVFSLDNTESFCRWWTATKYSNLNYYYAQLTDKGVLSIPTYASYSNKYHLRGVIKKK